MLRIKTGLPDLVFFYTIFKDETKRGYPMQSIWDEQGRVMLSKVKKLIKSLSFRIEGDATHGYTLEIGKRGYNKRVSEKPIDWEKASEGDYSSAFGETVYVESTLRQYRLTKKELIQAAEKYLSLTTPAAV